MSGGAGDGGGAGVGGRGGWSRREKALMAVAVVAIVVAIAAVVLCVGALRPPGAAAKVNDFYLSEDEVSAYVAEQRARNQQTDDATFASALLGQGLNPGTYRQSAINQLALNALVNKTAEELGVSPTDEEVQEQLDAMKQTAAFGDEDIWQKTLSRYGTDEEGVRAQLRTNLAEQALYDAEVAQPKPTDEQVREYAASAKAGSTDVHSWRIVFAGDDAQTRAKECADEIEQAGAGLNAEAFRMMAIAYSDDEGAGEDGGDYGWTAADDDSHEYLEEVSNMKDGTVSGPLTLGDEGITVIAYRDMSYTYPPQAECLELDLDALPAGLEDHLSSQESRVLWESACDAYLADLLGGAEITYYPMPKDVPYNVSASIAASATSESAESAGSAAGAGGAGGTGGTGTSGGAEGVGSEADND